MVIHELRIFYISMAATAIENDLENPILTKLALNSVIKSLQ